MMLSGFWVACAVIGAIRFLAMHGVSLEGEHSGRNENRLVMVLMSVELFSHTE